MVEDSTAETTAGTSDATTTPATGSVGDNVTAAPDWVVISLLALVAVIIVAMFAVTVYNMSAPRSTLKNLLGIKGAFLRKRIDSTVPVGVLSHPSARLMSTLALSAQVNTRTTRTTLAIAGFSLLGLATAGVLALSGTGVRDLRTQVMAGIVTLVATIAGFYFGQGSRTRSDGSTESTSSASPPAPPSITADPDARHEQFTIGTPTSYVPAVAGSPPPTLAILGDLPVGLAFDRATGGISGTAAGPTGSYPVQIIATNGITPDASLGITLVVV